MNFQGKTILIVDDEYMLRELMAMDFEELGARVLEAGNVDEALEVLSKNSPDLIISDIRMPGKDGVYLLNRIKKEGLSSAPVILITGFSDYTKAELCGLGAADVLYKPFDIDQLVESAEAVIARGLENPCL